MNRHTLRTLVALFCFAGAVAQTAGQVQSVRIKSFGFPDQVGATPSGNLILGRDGVFYGATIGNLDDLGTLFRVNADGTGYRLLHQFTPPIFASDLLITLIEGGDGALYGTTSSGGANNYGTVFKLNKDGSAFAILHEFNWDARSPWAELLEASDGVLYGTTSQSEGDYAPGTIFALNKDGSGFRVLRQFMGLPSNDAARPLGALLEGADGMLYGTSQVGGTNNNGSVFKLNKDGTGYQLLHSFVGPGGDALEPYAGLVASPDGTLYGTTYYGGTNAWPGYGTVFAVNPDGTNYRILHSFAWNGDGQLPQTSLCFGADGALCGVTPYGGSNNRGIVFRIETSGTGYALFYSFGPDTRGGFRPNSRLIPGPDGAFYGTTSQGGLGGLGTVFRLDQDGSNYVCLRSFMGAAGGDATHPQGQILQAADGRIYGASYDGGATNQGALFSVNADGTGYTVLHSFQGCEFRGPQDARYPNGGLAEGADGKLYGTTFFGGTNGSGQVYHINKDGGGYVLLHSFAATGSPDDYPKSGLLAGSDGRLYGTADRAVYRLETDGTGYKIVHAFDSSGSEGTDLQAGLCEGADGALYGTAYYGGTNGFNDSGTLFKIGKDGSGFVVLHNFGGLGNDGCRPQAAVMQADDGWLYGTASSGDFYSYFGTVFKLQTDGTGFEVLHRFGGAPDDGNGPFCTLVQGQDGALYGVTGWGGTSDLGTAFKINKDGTGYAVLRSFGVAPGDGSRPSAVLLGSDGVFLVSTYDGGDLGYESLFRLLPPQTPRMLRAGSNAGAAQVTVAGIAGCTYEVLFSTDLTDWTHLETFTMPAQGSYTSQTPTPAGPKVLYRAAWVP